MAASDSSYPGSLDTFTDKTASDWANASDMNAVQDGLIAIQTELGTDPAGGEATVAARIAAAENDISDLQDFDAAETRYAVIEVFAVTANCATGDGKKYIHIPAQLNGFNLVETHAYTPTAGTTGTMDIQVRNITDTQDMLSTKMTIDSGEHGTDTAATPAVIDTAHDDVATNDILAIDIDAIHTTPAQGLVVTLGFRAP